MKNNSNMNDIFANDNSRNKTKTIFLLSIVAIILIAVFLIIAWVMTRDNTIEPLDAQGENERITSPADSPQKEIPFAHNDDNLQSPDNKLGLNLSNMTTTPPQNVANMGNADSNIVEANANNANNFPPLPNFANYEDDPKYQENLKNLQDKKAEDSKSTESKTKDSKNVTTTQKVIAPPPPKELAKIAESNQKDSKKEAKPATTKDSKEIQNRSTNTPKDTKAADAKKPESKETKPQATSQNLAQNDKILQRPTQPVKKDNGTPASKGHYIQVGSFPAESKVDTLFMQNIQKYGYRIQKFDNNGKPFTRYLIGPYKDQQEAKSKLNEIKTQVNGNAIYKEVK